MQVTETRTEGLQREFQVVVPAADLEAKVNARLGELKNRVQIRGFRPGKVPVSHLKRVYGRGTMAEVIETAVREANVKIINDRGFKLATDPKVTMPSEQSEVERVLVGKSDLSYTVAIEIVPQIKLADFKTLKLERLATEVADTEVDEALERIAEQNRPYSDKGKDAKAEKGDRVSISMIGKVDGELFEGGSGDAVHKIGVGPFGEQLMGIAPGETRTVTVTLPPNYRNQQVAGKTATFEVSANSIEVPGEVGIDDAFATSLGMESLAKLKDAIKETIARQHSGVTRRRLKRQLLDQLDASHQFDPPPTLVDQEFEQVWKTILSELEGQGRTFADEDTTEEAARAEYRGIAARRVRLGLVLAEIGESNNIKITDDELNRALLDQARQFPGKEEQVWEFYRNNPEALASLRAPIFEEKVVDFLVELADVTDKKVSREELYKDEEEEGQPDTGALDIPSPMQGG
jgi:trigger factor